MFYQDGLDEILRFGDVLRGFVIATPNISNPLQTSEYSLEINHPNYCVILSPCCSIGQKMIVISPLLNVRSTFFSNTFFEKDLTRINRKMSANESVPPDVWENKFTEEVRLKKLSEGKTYAFIELFVYDKNLLFDMYELNLKGRGKIETNYYMIDFRNSFKVNCDKIISNTPAPTGLKILQLSIEARTELREKLAFYYSRIPEEDKLLEE